MLLLVICEVQQRKSQKLCLIYFHNLGVEAQTMTVWRQADRYEVPRIIYLNKMDKVGACFNACIKHIENKLKCKPLQVHIPIGSGKSFRGVIDLVDLSKKEWSSNHNSLGTSYSTKLFNIFIHSNMTLYNLHVGLLLFKEIGLRRRS
jgi:translation elongation factor EF-G